MKAGSTLYAVRDVPVLENRVYATAEDARACGRGDVVLAQDPESGLVRNEAFDARLITYDEGYQN
ncbi:MAG TPA: hypothetical protein VMK16_00295, partial [Acidimicrobiales bacterium]|nr:hypothetical protein [Acidimicrobiales bacterium]